MIVICLTIGFAVDLILGDPVWLYHPIRFIGKLISVFEKLLRKLFPKTPKGELAAGAFLTAFVVSISFGLSYGIIYIAGKIHPWFGLALQIFWSYQILAAKCLKTESMKVYNALKSGDLKEARIQISYLVGRDTQNLSEEEVAKATIETVAENTSDGVVAPLLFIALGGAPLGFAYKAVNTLDSMVGYKNDKYLYFGRVSAVLDDVANFIPARLTGLFMVLGAWFCGYDWKNAFRIFKRDRKKHLSPNSAQSESSCAGALRIQLGGTHDYFGKPVEKPTIGDDLEAVTAGKIKDANRLLYASAVVSIVFVNLINGAVHFLI